MQMKKRLIEEKASMAVYVSVVLLSFMLILSGIYFSSIAVRKSQLSTALKIKGAYESNNSDIEIIYQTQLGKVKTYVQDGLVLHYDGINNTGDGHDATATIWKDLSGNGNDGELQNFDMSDESGWTSNGLVLDGTDDGIYLADKMIDLYKDNATIEIVLNFTNSNNRDIIFGNYKQSNSVNIERGTSTGDYPLRCRFYYNGGAVDYVTSNDIYEVNTDITIGYLFNKTDTSITFLKDGEIKESISNSNFGEDYDYTSAWIGRDERGDSTSLQGSIYAIRIYNRLLTQEEIQQNYELDKERFNL